ncbi:MAG: hypothetical protein J6W64_00010 [Bacilli bacterium]|nr:hypothetical protein [Bacilli bacterium]
MKTVKDKLELLDKEIVKLQCELEITTNEIQQYKLEEKIKLFEELQRDLKVLGKFLGYYLVSTYDENKNKIILDLDCNSEDVQEIEKYVDECMDDLYNNKE